MLKEGARPKESVSDSCPMLVGETGTPRPQRTTSQSPAEQGWKVQASESPAFPVPELSTLRNGDSLCFEPGPTAQNSPMSEQHNRTTSAFGSPLSPPWCLGSFQVGAAFRCTSRAIGNSLKNQGGLSYSQEKSQADILVFRSLVTSGRLPLPPAQAPKDIGTAEATPSQAAPHMLTWIICDASTRL